MNKKVLLAVVALLIVLGGVLLFYTDGSGELLQGSIRSSQTNDSTTTGENQLDLENTGVETKSGTSTPTK